MNSTNSKANEVQNANMNLTKKTIDRAGESGVGPTGYFSGIATVDIVPFADNMLSLGNVNSQFSKVYTNELFVNDLLG